MQDKLNLYETIDVGSHFLVKMGASEVMKGLAAIEPDLNKAFKQFVDAYGNDHSVLPIVTKYFGSKIKTDAKSLRIEVSEVQEKCVQQL